MTIYDQVQLYFGSLSCILASVATFIIYLLHKKINNKTTRFALILWAIIVVCDVMGLLQYNLINKYKFLVLIATFPLAVVANTMISSIALELTNTSIKWKYVWFSFIAGFLGTGALKSLGFDKNIHMAPISIGVAFVLIYAGSKSFFKTFKDDSFFSSRWFAFTTLFFGFYMVVVPYLVESDALRIFSLAGHLVFTFCLSILVVASILERTTEENTRIKTEIKYQSLLIHTAKTAALGDMAAGMAHEINNPLAIIELGIEQIEDKISSDEDRTTMKRMHKAVKRITNIINALKIFAKEDTILEKEKANLKSVIENTLSLCEQTFNEQNIKISLKNIDNANTELEINQSHLSQVLYNLLSNAADALHNSNDKRINIEVRKDKICYLILISNTGPKIEQQYYDKLFQPFFTTKEPGKGTGLGLSTSKGLIESMNGKLYLDKQAELTTFAIQLPL